MCHIHLPIVGSKSSFSLSHLKMMYEHSMESRAPLSTSYKTTSRFLRTDRAVYIFLILMEIVKAEWFAH